MEEVQRGNGNPAGSEAPSVQLHDLWKPSSTGSARQNMASPFSLHILRRNLITAIQQPIKKFMHNLPYQNEYDLHSIVGNVSFASRKKVKRPCLQYGLIWF